MCLAEQRYILCQVNNEMWTHSNNTPEIFVFYSSAVHDSHEFRILFQPRVRKLPFSWLVDRSWLDDFCFFYGLHTDIRSIPLHETTRNLTRGTLSVNAHILQNVLHVLFKQRWTEACLQKERVQNLRRKSTSSVMTPLFPPISKLAYFPEKEV